MLNEKTLSTQLYSTADVRKLDEIVISRYQIPGYTLMQRAGEEAVNLISYYWPAANKIVIVCGNGNNGGDGMVVARLLKSRGLMPEVYLFADPEVLHGDARAAYEAAKINDVVIKVVDNWQDNPQYIQNLSQADLIVDALIGSGLKNNLSGSILDVVNAMNNATKAPIIAIDIPTGLNSDTGVPMPVAIDADVTITFVGKKAGLFLGEGINHSGKVHFSHLGIPFSAYDNVQSIMNVLQYNQVQVLPPRRRYSHKGDYGHVVVVGGNRGYGGAVQLCGVGALRVGSGLVTIVTSSVHSNAVLASYPELMVNGLTDDNLGYVTKILPRGNVIALGVGLGRDSWGEQVFINSISVSDNMKMVVDADGLYWLSKRPIQRDNWVLTPHIGEAARLLSVPIKVIETDRVGAAKDLQTKYGGVILLKGAGTIICDQNQQISICTAGNPGMAVGGMGDLLTGIISGLMSQGLDMAEAARYGAWLHATAGDKASEFGQRGLLPHDLFFELRKLVG